MAQKPRLRVNHFARFNKFPHHRRRDKSEISGSFIRQDNPRRLPHHIQRGFVFVRIVGAFCDWVSKRAEVFAFDQLFRNGVATRYRCPTTSAAQVLIALRSTAANIERIAMSPTRHQNGTSLPFRIVPRPRFMRAILSAYCLRFSGGVA